MTPRRSGRLTPALALPALLLVSASGSPDPDAPPAIQASLERMRHASAAVSDATYTLHRQEWQDGEALAAQVISVRLRRPEDLYLRWEGPAFAGRELIYRQGWNGGRLRVSGGPLVPTLDLDPTGALAMRGSRQPVWMASILRTAAQILRGADTLSADPELEATYQDLGAITVRGEPSHCYRAALPVDRDPHQYAPQVLVCMSLIHGLPTRFAAWERAGADLRMVEDYVFSDVVVNPGLGEGDFDPTNPAYGF